MLCRVHVVPRDKHSFRRCGILESGKNATSENNQPLTVPMFDDHVTPPPVGNVPLHINEATPSELVVAEETREAHRSLSGLVFI